jgi:hypothetical protein
MTRKFLIPTENQEQRALVKWLSLHPILKDFYCKNNNEGKRTEGQTWNLKLMGLRPGVPDLFIYYPSPSGKHGLWLEMKRNMNYPPSARKGASWVLQDEFIERVKKVGFEASFCYGWEDGKRIIESYLLS